MQRSEIEIMAPVGSYEALAAAIQAGADSVYFGVGKLNMRSASAANFTLDDLAKIVATAHAAGVKTYLTVNTIVYEDEMLTVHEVIDRAKAEGIDAIIATDFAAILYARRIGVEVHISTQSNISNSETVKFFSQWADTVVLARELTLEQVAQIHRQIVENDIRGPRGELVGIEMFAHGALCMSISGKCYLSLYETNCSANRGACRQLCRRKYTVTDTETGAALDIDGRYVLSPKDLCTVDFLDRFIGAGVRVLKIEGRARGAEYVKRVVSCYDEALRAIEAGTYTPALAAGLKERLATVFNRGFWEGYYAGRPVAEHSQHYGSAATRQGDELLQENIGGRGTGRSRTAVRGRRDFLHGCHHRHRRTDARRAARHRRHPGAIRGTGHPLRRAHRHTDPPRRPALQIRRCGIDPAVGTISITKNASGRFFVTVSLRSDR